MTLTINGKTREITGEASLQNAVAQLCKDPNLVVTELNGQIIDRARWAATPIAANDTLELVTFMGGGSPKPDPFILADKEFKSRFLLGTGKFKNKADVKESILASGAEIVTVALRRIDLEQHEDNILQYLPNNVTLLTNTSGARTADEAVRLAHLAKASGQGHWIKVEVINDSKYLLPDNEATITATKILAAEGFVVLPYVSADLYVARRLVEAGAAAIMPLGSFIGSNQGLRARDFIKVLIEEIDIPVIVDAGIGAPSHACEAMELGASAVLVNTAVAIADNPAAMAKAFAQAVEAGRTAYLSGLPAKRPMGEASSPLTGFLFE